MVNLRGIGAVLGIGVMACVFLATFDNHWMISVPNALTGNSAQLFKLHQGLWKQCQTIPGMQQQCNDYRGAIQHMPGSLLAQRAMMILACVLGTFGMIGAVASMDLVNAVKTARGKKQVCYASSLCFLACGALVMGAISWEAYNIIVLHQFEPGMSAPIYNNIHYTIGHDIYIGWSAAIAAFVVAGALLFGACNTDEEDDYEVYEPGQTYDGNSSTGYKSSRHV